MDQITTLLSVSQMVYIPLRRAITSYIALLAGHKIYRPRGQYITNCISFSCFSWGIFAQIPRSPKGISKKTQYISYIVHLFREPELRSRCPCPTSRAIYKYIALRARFWLPDIELFGHYRDILISDFQILNREGII